MVFYDWRVPLCCFLIYCVIEFAWLGVMNNRFYKPYLMKLQPQLVKLQVDAVAAILAYVSLLSAAYLFIVHDVAASPQPISFTMMGFLKAFLIGLAAYGVYNFTNKALLADFSWRFVIVDIAWGVTAMTLTYVTAVLVRKTL
jgi:uncharacterized membrane protein